MKQSDLGNHWTLMPIAHPSGRREKAVLWRLFQCHTRLSLGVFWVKVTILELPKRVFTIRDFKNLQEVS
jgi:hypothetical protein